MWIFFLLIFDMNNIDMEIKLKTNEGSKTNKQKLKTRTKNKLF